MEPQAKFEESPADVVVAVVGRVTGTDAGTAVDAANVVPKDVAG